MISVRAVGRRCGGDAAPSRAQLWSVPVRSWRQILFANAPQVRAQVPACRVGPDAEIEDVARRRRAQERAAVCGFGSRVHLLQRRDREVEKTRKFAGIVANESLGDIRRRVQSRVIELIAESEMSGKWILGGFSLDASHQLFAQTKCGQISKVADYHAARRGRELPIGTPSRERLKEGGRSPGGLRRRLRFGLIVAEVAMTSLLLVAAGLTLRSFERVLSQPAGSRRTVG